MIHVASILQQGIRNTDILCRHGGEEFVIILDQTDVQTALIVAEKLRASLANAPLTHGDLTLPTTISIGVAPYGDDLQTLQVLLKQSDEALYKAKQNGRNQVCLYS